MSEKIICLWFSHKEDLNSADCDCACAIYELENKNKINLGAINFDLLKPAAKKVFRFENDRYILWNAPDINGISIVNNETLKLIDHPNQIENINQKESLIHTLLQRKLIKPNNEEPKIHSNILSAWLHLSNNCNYNCNYCYIKRSNELMDFEIGLKIINQIFRNAIENNIKKITLKFAGGEALLNYNIVKQLQQYALQLAEEKEIELKSLLLTNGTLLNDSIIEDLYHLQIKVIVSIDGFKEYHEKNRNNQSGNSQHQVILENLAKLKDRDLLENISITISELNSTGLAEFTEFCLKNNYHFNYNFVRSSDKETNEINLKDKILIKDILSAYKVIENNLPNRSLLSGLLDRVNLAFPHQYPCGAGNGYLVFDHKGNSFNCQMEISNIKNDKSLFERNLAIDCEKCEIKDNCVGGCPLIRTEEGKSPYCNIYRALYKEVLKLEALRIMKYEEQYVFCNYSG